MFAMDTMQAVLYVVLVYLSYGSPDEGYLESNSSLNVPCLEYGTLQDWKLLKFRHIFIHNPLNYKNNVDSMLCELNNFTNFSELGPWTWLG